MSSVSSPRPNPEPDEIYCDESLNRGGYDLIGGLWLTAANAQRLRRVIAGVRERHDYAHEFKWKNASGARLSGVYCELAEKLGDQIWAGRASFNCIVLPRKQVDYATYHQDDHELGYYKFVHWLIRKRIQGGRSYLVYLDYRTTRSRTRLTDLKRTINGAGRADYSLGYDCCRDVQARNSREDDLLQATDLLIGAVGWHCAENHRNPGASMAKNELANRLCVKIGRSDLATHCPPSERRFNVWRWRPQRRQTDRPPRS